MRIKSVDLSKQIILGQHFRHSFQAHCPGDLSFSAMLHSAYSLMTANYPAADVSLIANPSKLAEANDSLLWLSKYMAKPCLAKSMLSTLLLLSLTVPLPAHVRLFTFIHRQMMD